MVDADDGMPLVPMELELKAADGVHSTRSDSVKPACHHWEQVLPTMQVTPSWNLSKKVVHVIDREADSLAHFREWDGADHLRFAWMMADG